MEPSPQGPEPPPQGPEPPASPARPHTGHRHPLAAGLLVVAAAAPALPPPAALTLLVLGLAAWAALRPPPRDLAVVAVGGLVAAAALLAGWRTAAGPDLEDPGWRAATGRSYAAAWNTLEAEAAQVASVLDERGLARDVGGEEERLAAVRALAELVEAGDEAGGTGRRALMLVDPDGEPVAWAGEGLLHELQPEEIPTAGRTFEASFGAVTLLAVHPLDGGRRPWRAVAARSHATDRLPFVRPLPLLGAGEPDRSAGLSWSLVWLPEQATPGAAVLAPPPAGREGGERSGEEGAGEAGEALATGAARPPGATPLLVVEREPGAVPRETATPRRLAWGALGLALLLLAAMRATGLALAAPAVARPAGTPYGGTAPGGTGQGGTGQGGTGQGGRAPGGTAPGEAVYGGPVPGGTETAGLRRTAGDGGADAGPAGGRAGGGPPERGAAAADLAPDTDLAPAAPSPVRAVVGIILVAVAGGLALARAAGAQSDALLALAVGLVLAVAGVGLGPRWRRASGLRGKGLTALAGAAAVVLLAVLAWALQLESASFDPAAHRGSPVTLYTLRLALTAAATGLLALAGGRLGAGRDPVPPSPAPPLPAASLGGRGELWAWASLPLLLAGAAAVDLPWLALPLFAVVGAALALWTGQRRRSPAVLAVLVVLAAVLAAGVWESTHRTLLRDHLAHRVLPRLGPPAPEERGELAGRLDAFFSGADLTRFIPRTPAGLGREDLAFLLWQASPLARPHALSRVVVEPLDGGLPSAFSLGVPAAEGTAVEPGPPGWVRGGAGPVRDGAVTGSASLSHRGEPWAVVRWSLLPLPGFRLGSGGELENVEAALLRGLPGGVAETGLPGGAVYVRYDAAGRASASPWREQTRLPAALAGPGPVEARVGTPAGPAWAVARPLPAVGGDGGGREVLYLPWLTPRAALERVGTLTLEVLLAVLAAAFLALLVVLPRATFRGFLRRAVRSYSRRLLLVYTVLLLVPLLLLNVVLVVAVENRLRQEQRAAGEAALASAQKVVGDYLASVEPGFDLANVLDDELLSWISEVLRHEINLYWGSEVWASSKPELFTARLLPKRIPGESFAGIAFLGYDLAARTNRVGEVSYLELYAPLRVPGEEVEPANFFLSMPLLAQQEEVARELAALRRQALLVTVVLILLVSAVGLRLSRSFTRPLTELVEGTRRIAAGATSLDLSPSELELAALVEAVDEMARRIAVGRERLVREKQVVERMVEHITSGVVSLDHRRRVLMRNRVARELLGVEVGERLDEALARRQRLAGLVPWIAAADRHLAQRTVRLLPPEAPDGGAPDGEVEEGPGGEGPGGEGPAPGAAAPEGEGGEAGTEREWTLVWVPVPGAGEPAALLVVEDVTETLRSQRLEAWAEMARIIAHEIKNPLTPIRLNIEHVQQVWSDQRGRDRLDPRFGEVLERCAVNVLQQVDELREIAGEFSTYSRIPKIEPRRGDLVAAMEELVQPYRTAPPAGVEVELEVGEGAQGGIEARFDRRLLARAVRNLVENALRASSGGGRVVLRVERLPPRTALPETAGSPSGGASLLAAEARISVLDAGPGIAPNLLQRIFDPYFSTFDTGTGLGLPIARRIAEEHGGSITARNRTGGGLEVSITLPAE